MLNPDSLGPILSPDRQADFDLLDTERSALLDKETTIDRKIANDLLIDIISWRIEPGSWIRERSVAARYGCSHSPVREAFRHLSKDGFVEAVPWRGARVVDIDRYNVDEVFDLWSVLIARQFASAAGSMNSTHSENLAALFRAFSECVDAGQDTPTQLAAMWQTGAYIHELCTNRLLSASARGVSRIAHWQHKLLDHPRVEALQPGFGRRFRDLYKKAITHLAEGDPVRAEKSALVFMEYSRATIGPILQALTAETSTIHRKSKKRYSRL